MQQSVLVLYMCGCVWSTAACDNVHLRMLSVISNSYHMPMRVIISKWASGN